MDVEGQAAHLGELTRAFYERTHDSFSATRQSAWRGWDELWNMIGPALEARAAKANGLRIADIACGNLRFLRFLQQKTKAPLEVHAFDENKPLLKEGLRALLDASDGRARVHEQPCDIEAALREGRDFLAGTDPCDLAVSFGFMHHLPLAGQREELLRLMAAHTAAGGFLAASFWRFADDARLREKAEEATMRARRAGVVGDLAAGDYLLGWQDDAEAFRFCHHFTEAEIDALSVSLADEADEVARFSADGKSGSLNRYAVWRRHD